MLAMKFDVEKFDERINFGLWQVQVKDLLIQSRLHKALKGKPTIASGDLPLPLVKILQDLRFLSLL